MANIEIRRNGGAATPAPIPAARTWDPFQIVQSLMRWDPFREMEPIWSPGERAPFTPAFEVKETDKAYIFRADLPGVKESDLEITLTGDRLSVSGKRDREEEKKGDTYYVYECSYGQFTRTFTLPADVEGQRVTAELKNGVLSLVLPKTPEAQPRKIPVGAGERSNPTGKA